MRQTLGGKTPGARAPRVPFPTSANGVDRLLSPLTTQDGGENVRAGAVRGLLRSPSQSRHTVAFFFNDIHAVIEGKLFNKRAGEGLRKFFAIAPRCNVISVSDTLRRELIASVGAGNALRVDRVVVGNNYKKKTTLSSSATNCFLGVALVEYVYMFAMETQSGAAAFARLPV